MIPLYKPFMVDLPELKDILNSGKLSYGHYGQKFENRLKEIIGSENLITISSFNMAILVVLTTLNLKSGDSVIASPMACLSSTQPLISFGLNVLWADVDPIRGTLDPKSVKNLAQKFNTKAIFHNHYCGIVGHIDEINSIGHEFNIPVIDDCIEAFGSKYKGKILGNVGTDVTIFSFNPVRYPNTIDGGAIVFKNNNYYSLSKIVRDAGIDRTLFRDDNGEINENYDINQKGHSATMSEVNSYIGFQQLSYFDYLIKKQNENGNKWLKEPLIQNGLQPIISSEFESNYWVFGVLTNEKKSTILRFREKGYYASGVHTSNNKYSVFNYKVFLPGVDKFNRSFVAIPSGWWVENISL